MFTVFLPHTRPAALTARLFLLIGMVKTSYHLSDHLTFFIISLPIFLS